MRRRFEHYMAMNPDDIGHGPAGRSRHRHEDCDCLLYTSDAADD